MKNTESKKVIDEKIFLVLSKQTHEKNYILYVTNDKVINFIMNISQLIFTLHIERIKCVGVFIMYIVMIISQ